MRVDSSREVLVLGDLFLDLVMSGFSKWPRPGEEFFADQFHKEIGGGAAITACGLAKLGVQTAVVGIVGADDGPWVIDNLRARGVNTSAILQSATEPTAFTVSVSTVQDRTFLTYCGANRELPAMLDALINTENFAGTRHIHLAHAMEPARLLAAFESFRSNGKTLSVDVGWHPAWFEDQRSVAALKLANVFFPNEREAEAITGEREPRPMLEAMQRAGLQRVALKLGQKGAALLWDGEIIFQEPRAIEAVDTTGAGDCFDAGFLYAWLKGMEPRQCLRAGSACGEMSARALGGIAGFPSREELETILCSAK